MSYVINPKTGRNIKKGGSTYEKIKKSSYYKDKLVHQKPHRLPVHHTKGARSVSRSLSRARATHAGHSVGRGSALRGWHPIKKASGRRALAEKCEKKGEKCFLKPPFGFPVCDKNCKIDCKGVHIRWTPINII